MLLFCPSVHAHIGSPTVFFEGPAGPYPVRVTIIPPGVVPGLAQIHVRVHSGQPQKVTVLPVRYDIGTRGSPPPDVAKLVPGETNFFTAQLWFMNSGAYSVFVDVSGPEGHGTAVVPLDSLAYQRLGMSRGMAALFFSLGAFLVALLVCVVGAAVREASLPEGTEPSVSRRRLAMLGMLIAAAFAIGALKFGDRWWNSVDNEFLSRRLYQPPSLTPTIETSADGTQSLLLRIGARKTRDTTGLIPDHGQLMHLFLVRKQGDAFAHLHPIHDKKLEGPAFRTTLPPLPRGDYLLYADITHESGLTLTLTNVLHLTNAIPNSNSTPALASTDDAYDLTPPQSPTPISLTNGFQLKPNFGPAFRANEEATLNFEFAADTGAPAPLEPYLGMYGHLMIQNDDGSVFIHLHPLGSISMTSQRQFAEREHAAYLANQSLDLLCAPPSRTLAFPYAFPKPGRYRLWLQTKLAGRILTFPFTVTVE